MQYPKTRNKLLNQTNIQDHTVHIQCLCHFLVLVFFVLYLFSSLTKFHDLILQFSLTEVCSVRQKLATISYTKRRYWVMSSRPITEVIVEFRGTHNAFNKGGIPLLLVRSRLPQTNKNCIRKIMQRFSQFYTYKCNKTIQKAKTNQWPRFLT